MAFECCQWQPEEATACLFYLNGLLPTSLLPSPRPLPSHRCCVLASFSSIFLRLGTGTVRLRFLHVKSTEDYNRIAVSLKILQNG